MDDLKKTVKDSVSLSFAKDIKGKNVYSYLHTESRVIPGSDNIQWTFSYSPARDSYSSETEKNHVRLSLTFIPEVEGRVTIEGKNLPTRMYEIPKFETFYWHYVNHNEFNAAINDELELKCTVEIDIESANPEIEQPDQKYTVHQFPDEKCVEFNNNDVKAGPIQENKENNNEIKEAVSNLLESIESYIDPKVVDAAPSTSTEPKKKPVRAIIDEIFIPIRKSLRFEKQFWNPVTTKGSTNGKYPWSVTYNLDQNAVHTVGLIVEFAVGKGIKEVDGMLIVEAKGLPSRTYPIEKSGKFTFDHLPYNDVYNAIPKGEKLDLSCTLVIDGNSVKKFSIGFDGDGPDCPPDFVIKCGDDQYKVHKITLKKISPVFDTLIKHNPETSNNSLEIHDFPFKTVETALNTCLGRPCGELSAELAIDVLRFVEKYVLMDVFDSFEKVIERNLSVFNFFEVFRYVNDCDRKDLLEKCAAFYKKNKDVLKNTETFAALPGPLIVKLLRSAYKFEYELDIFLYARENNIKLDMAHMEVKTLSDFFRTVPFAYQYYEDSLILQCAKYFHANKNVIVKNQEYELFHYDIKDSLNNLACCFAVDDLWV